MIRELNNSALNGRYKHNTWDRRTYKGYSSDSENTVDMIMQLTTQHSTGCIHKSILCTISVLPCQPLTHYNILCTYVCANAHSIIIVMFVSKNNSTYCTHVRTYSETSLIRHSMGPENNVGLGGCWIIECLLPYLCMVTVPHIMVGLERMLDYRGVGLERFHCTSTFKRCIN